ncbi:hypothetical protein P4123_05335 [Pseudomonas aeruginosa]|nr:hypothetical protein [Pseudomonas aeruginosa]
MGALGKAGFRLLGVAGAEDVIALLAEIGLEKLTNHRVVVDHQYARNHRYHPRLRRAGVFLVLGCARTVGGRCRGAFRCQQQPIHY